MKRRSSPAVWHHAAKMTEAAYGMSFIGRTRKPRSPRVRTFSLAEYDEISRSDTSIAARYDFLRTSRRA